MVVQEINFEVHFYIIALLFVLFDVETYFVTSLDCFWKSLWICGLFSAVYFFLFWVFRVYL
jgi:NADH:ubiquinone oxidoreductase subunit 3 (subunit A)